MQKIPNILHAPDDLPADVLRDKLAELGCWMQAQRQHGTNCRAKRLDLADVIPMHRAKRWPGIAPEGAA